MFPMIFHVFPAISSGSPARHCAWPSVRIAKKLPSGASLQQLSGQAFAPAASAWEMDIP